MTDARDTLANELVKLVTQRANLLTTLLGTRHKITETMQALGGPGKHDNLLPLLDLEVKLQEVDEALGILRYGGYMTTQMLTLNKSLAKSVETPQSQPGQSKKLVIKQKTGVASHFQDDTPYVSSIDAQNRTNLDTVVQQGHGGYSVIAPGGGKWLDSPHAHAIGRMYTKAGTGNDTDSKLAATWMAHDLRGDNFEDTEGNVVNPDPNGVNGWVPPSFADMRPSFTGKAIERTPQVGITHQLTHPQELYELAERAHALHVAEQPGARPGAWYVPDITFTQEQGQPAPQAPPHFKPMTMNWRDTPVGRQLVYTKKSTLPGFKSRPGFAHETLHELLNE